jgi:hypothetical protein
MIEASKILLASQSAYTGCTTIAHLIAEGNYAYVSMSDALMQHAARGYGFSYYEMKHNKAKFRQQLSIIMKADEDTILMELVHTICQLTEWTNVVMEKARTHKQLELFDAMGFTTFLIDRKVTAYDHDENKAAGCDDDLVCDYTINNNDNVMYTVSAILRLQVNHE